MKTKRHITINVMASLLVGDPMNPGSEASLEARKNFRAHLQEMKRLKVTAVSVDLWWGLLQPEPGPIDWTKPGAAYYDWIVNEIIAAGLKVIPILSFHQCGGNVGDDVFVPIPKWVWEKLARILGDARFAKFVSEQGNECDEYVSFWATKYILEDYLAVVKSFRDHFADRAKHIAEINISLGPAGELRYPSYNSHDKNVDYPKRGALQCYSKLAIDSWRAHAIALYGDEKGVDKAWGTKISEGQALLPPSNPLQFFTDEDHLDMQYGRDLFDWYSEQPRIHARLVLKGAFDILAADDSPMKGIDIGAKVPGIHWLTGKWVFDTNVTSEVLQAELNKILADFARENAGKMDATTYGAQLSKKVSDHVRNRTQSWVPEKDGGTLVLGSRLAELAAGLIRTSDSADWEKDEAGRGYRPLIKLFSEFEGNANSRLVLHFTCLEMADGENAAAGAASVACSLVQWVGAEATRQGVPIKGENAVSWTLPEVSAWERMRLHLLRNSADPMESHSLMSSVLSSSGMQEGAHTVVTGVHHTSDSMLGVNNVEYASAHPLPREVIPYYEGLTILRMNHVADNPVANQEMAKTVAWVTGEVGPEPVQPAASTTVNTKTPGGTARDSDTAGEAGGSMGPPAQSAATTGDTGSSKEVSVQAPPVGDDKVA